MPEIVTVNQELGIIEIRSYGNISSKDITSSLDSIKHLHKEHNICRILVDALEQESTPDTISIFDTFSNLPRSVKYAVVTSKLTTGDDAYFAETVTQNRGIMLKLFATKEQALEWLFAE